MKYIPWIVLYFGIFMIMVAASNSPIYGHKVYPDFWRTFGIIERDCK